MFLSFFIKYSYITKNHPLTKYSKYRFSYAQPHASWLSVGKLSLIPTNDTTAKPECGRESGAAEPKYAVLNAAGL